MVYGKKYISLIHVLTLYYLRNNNRPYVRCRLKNGTRFFVSDITGVSRSPHPVCLLVKRPQYNLYITTDKTTARLMKFRIE